MFLQFPLIEQEDDPLLIERNYHEKFIESHSLVFIGRTSLLESLHDFVVRSAETPLVLVGQPGSGKTSLVSYFARSLAQQMVSNPDTVVITHFIGASPGSISIRHTLHRLVSEISLAFEFCLPIPSEFKELQALFLSLIKIIGSDKPHKKLVLVLDALNQLDNTNHSHTLDWLPDKFPTNVRVILSMLEGDAYDTMKQRPINEILVGPLSRQEQAEIVEKTLWVYRKKLSPKQLDLLLLKTDAHKPLYLIVACEELRVFGVFENLEGKIRTMASTIPSLFEEVLRRLEGDNDPDLLVRCLSLLTCSRGGLLESEMKQLLGNPEQNDPLPQAPWTKLYRSIQHYMRPGGDSGEGVIDFFHQQLPKAVRRLYLDDRKEMEINYQLFNFFWLLGDKYKNGTWCEGNLRSLQHTVYHQIKAQNWISLKGM